MGVRVGSGNRLDGDTERKLHDHDIPFWRFLMLVRVWRRAPSRGANGWRARVVIVTDWRECFVLWFMLIS